MGHDGDAAPAPAHAGVSPAELLSPDGHPDAHHGLQPPFDPGQTVFGWTAAHHGPTGAGPTDAQQDIRLTPENYASAWAMDAHGDGTLPASPDGRLHDHDVLVAHPGPVATGQHLRQNPLRPGAEAAAASIWGELHPGEPIPHGPDGRELTTGEVLSLAAAQAADPALADVLSQLAAAGDDAGAGA
jgi:hypothetical protein